MLSQRGVSFEERDVSRSQAYARELVQKTGQMGVPVTLFDGEVVIGFDRPRLEQILGRGRSKHRISFGASVADAGEITAKKGQAITYGAYVGGTRPGSVARKIGLVPGDIVTRLNAWEISSAGGLERALSGLKSGDRLTVVFLRGGRSMNAETIV